MKHRDFLPSIIGLSNYKDKIQSAINNGNEQLKKIQGQLTSLENSVEDAQKVYCIIILN